MQHWHHIPLQPSIPTTISSDQRPRGEIEQQLPQCVLHEEGVWDEDWNEQMT